MTKNPLLAENGSLPGGGRRFDEETMRQWCADRNRWAERIGLDWWYRVVFRKQGFLDVPEIEKLDGIRALDARARAKGQPIQYFNSAGPEAQEIHAWVRKVIAQNPYMTQAEFNRLVEQGRV